MKISIGIPTYNRPDLLKQALLSCLEQTYKPYEIIISDDSKNDHSTKLVDELIKEQSSKGIIIRYFRNQPSLGQRNNVNQIVEVASGDKFVLLHDDDLLLPNALELMLNCFLNRPDINVVFGDQYVINDDGVVNVGASENANRGFFRTKEFEGDVLSPLDAALVQQFPNDAYMIDTVAIKKVKYATRENENVGTAIDFEFGLRLAQNELKFYYLNQYTAKYRITAESVSTRNADGPYRAFKLIQQVKYKSQLDHVNYRDLMLERKAAAAIVMALKCNEIKDSWKIFFSKAHQHKILSLGGIKRFLLILAYSARLKK